MTLQVRPIQPHEAEAAWCLLRDNGWAHRVPSVDVLQDLIEHSQRAVVAVEQDKLIGFARAITDGLSNGYLSMVVVDGAHRHRGVGRALVDAVTGDDSGVTWVLRAGREGAADFFAALGFEPSKVAMERRRNVREQG